MHSLEKGIRRVPAMRQSVLLSSSPTIISRHWITFCLLNASTLIHQSQKPHKIPKGNIIQNRRNKAAGAKGHVFPCLHC